MMSEEENVKKNHYSENELILDKLIHLGPFHMYLDIFESQNTS